MSCLDAKALTQDPEGLGFLKAVLDVPAGAQPVAGAFDPDQTRQGWTVYPTEADLTARTGGCNAVRETV